MEKEHIKMYKSGKRWLTALVTVAAVSLLGWTTAAHADTTVNTTGSQTTVTAVTSTATAASNASTTVMPNGNSDATPVNNACLDGISSDQQGNLVLSGWHASNIYQPGTQHYLLVLNGANNQELYRTPATVINRPDVQAVYPQAAISGNGGFQATIPTARLAGADSYRIVSRYTTQANGEPSGNQDFWFPVISSKAGCLDSFKVTGSQITASGWHADDQAAVKPYHYLILFDQTHNREVTRKLVNNRTSADVQRAMPLIANSSRVRFNVSFDLTPAMLNNQLVLISRYSGSQDGNSNYSDYYFNNRSLTIGDHQAGCLDRFGLNGWQVIAAGWHAADASAMLPNHYLILFDQTLGREIARKKVATTASADVAQNGFGNIANADHSRFSATFNISPNELGHRLVLLSRYSDDPNYGEGHHVDQWFNNTIDLHEKQAAWLDTLAYEQGDSIYSVTDYLDVAGWHADDMAALYPHHFIILYDGTTNRELARKEVTNTASPDVARANSDILNANRARFSTTFEVPDDAFENNHIIRIISRYSDSSNGEGHYSQEWISNRALNVPYKQGDYLYDRAGNAYRIPTDSPEHVAQLIAQLVGPVKTTQLAQVEQAARYVNAFCNDGRYTMSGPYYNKPYGVFIAHEFSCAGGTRAMGLVLNELGYSYRHVNENLYTHQWCETVLDGRKAWVDGTNGYAGYGEYGE